MRDWVDSPQEKWIGFDWKDPEDFKTFESEMLADLETQLAANDLKLVKVLPNQWCLGAIAGTHDGQKWLHITTADVREDPEWYQHIRLRRMSSERDWKGDAFHCCEWQEIGASVATYMGDEYDDEIL